MFHQPHDSSIYRMVHESASPDSGMLSETHLGLAAGGSHFVTLA
jgi:hypothetical protein